MSDKTRGPESGAGGTDGAGNTGKTKNPAVPINIENHRTFFRKYFIMIPHKITHISNLLKLANLATSIRIIPVFAFFALTKIRAEKARKTVNQLLSHISLIPTMG
jgi:hypothetical protein